MARNIKNKAPKRGRHKIKDLKAKGKQRQPDGNFLNGILKVHREGNFGFVLPDDPSQVDIFVPARRMAGAFDGDHVKVSYWSQSGEGRREGSVEEILERGKRCLVGVLKKEKQQYVVACLESKREYNFLVDTADLKGARLGETIGIEVVEYPRGNELGAARVIQLFGARGEEQTEIDIIILKHQLPTEFPQEVLQQAKSIAADRNIELASGREDLRELPLVTVDGETARDFDDAICVQQEGDDYRLWVSIADVSHYIQPGTAIDKEALRRGTSVYFTQKVIPMLPEELSNDLCSLRPHEDRYAFTAEMLFDCRGKIKDSRFYRSVICSQARLTYTQVAKAMVEQDAAVQQKISTALPMLEQAFALFRVLRKARLNRGSIDFDMPDPEIVQNIESGDIETIVKSERNDAHMLIEEFMVAANEAVATWITRQKQAMIYRVHGQPDSEKIAQFQSLLKNLGFCIKFSEQPSPKEMGKVIKLAAGHAEERLVQHFMLRTMKQAVYSPKNEGHFGLASSCYTHFTSPIRRYPDLEVHRILGKILSQGKAASSRGDKGDLKRLEVVSKQASRRERASMEAEWESLDLMTALFMQRFLGQTFKGMVARVTKFGFFVELKKYFIQGLVLLEDISNEYYVFEESHFRLRGKRSGRIIKIGTELSVQVAKVDIEARRVYFHLAS